MASSSRESASRLGISLDRHAEVPLGVQLAWDLRSRIISGELAPGERLPGLRELAEAVAVNANTVRTVYHRLEQDGLIETRQGSGTYVTGSPAQREALIEITKTAAQSARDRELDPRDVAAALYMGLQGGDAADGAAARRRRLRNQLATLEQTLAEIEARRPDLAPPLDPTARPSRPRLLSVAELEDQRERLLARLTAAQERLASDPPGDDPAGRPAAKKAAAPSRPRAKRRRVRVAAAKA